MTLVGPKFMTDWLCSAAQLCPTLCNAMDWSPPDSSVHGILQARVLETVAMPSSRESSQPRVFHIAVGFFTIWDTKEAQLWLNPYQKWKRHTKTNGQKNCYNAVISWGIQMIFRNNQNERILSMFLKGLLLFSHLFVSDSLQTHGCSTPDLSSFTTSWSWLEFMSIAGDTIQSCCSLWSHPLWPQSFPASGSF